MSYWTLLITYLIKMHVVEHCGKIMSFCRIIYDLVATQYTRVMVWMRFSYWLVLCVRCSYSVVKTCL